MYSSTAGLSGDGASTKCCTLCHENKALADFRDVKRRGRVEKHPWCHSCLATKQAEQYQRHKVKRDAEAKAWREVHPERAREHRQVADRKRRAAQTETDVNRNTVVSWAYRLRKQGLTPDDYHRILAEQGGGCAICGVTDPGKAGAGKANRFAADHCHVSGKSRGLLCHRCNRGLGYFKDNPSWLRRAADYVEA